jgi:4-amino-4-deoxy-L-arabinose transferase-like glycosyltransferase
LPLIFPIAAYCLLVLLVRDLRSTGWRSAMITAAIFWGAALSSITELLGAPRWLTRTGVSAAWLCVSVMLLGAYLWNRRSGSEARPNSTPLPTLPTDTGRRVLLGSLILLTLFVGITAVVSPPNTWDAMDYHLPRVIQWVGNHGVQSFPTPDYAQLVHPPWAEYAMLHFMLLWGNDQFVNIVQWVSLVGSILCISLIAKQLGAGPWGQMLAAVICATIPEGVLEASGAKNTYVTAFWVAAFVYLLLRWKDESDWFTTITTGLAIGLAVLTKGLAYLLLPSFFVLWFLWAPTARVVWLKRAAVIGLIAIALNAPQFVRNYRLTGSPIGQPVPENGPRMSFAVDRISFTGACANLLRNISLHVGGPFGR